MLSSLSGLACLFSEEATEHVFMTTKVKGVLLQMERVVLGDQAGSEGWSEIFLVSVAQGQRTPNAHAKGKRKSQSEFDFCLPFNFESELCL